MPSAISSTLVSIAPSPCSSGRTLAGSLVALSHRWLWGGSGDPPIPTPESWGSVGWSWDGGGGGDGDGGRLGSAAHTELGQDPADVVLGRLGADVEPFADLGVRETGADELEHVALALGQ